MTARHSIAAVLLALLLVPATGTAQSGRSRSYDYAAALNDRGLFEQAVPAWRAFLKEESDGQRTEKARFHLSEALFQLQRHEAALQEFDKFLALNPRSLRREAQFRRGEILFKLQKYAECKQAMQPVMKQTGDEMWAAAAYTAAESHLKLKQPEPAGKLLSAVIQAPENKNYRAPAALALGFIAFDKKDFAEAATWFAEARNGATDKEVAAESQLMSGEVALQLGKLEESDRCFDAAIRSGVASLAGDAWIGRGRIRVRAERLKEASKCFKRAASAGAETKAARAMIREAALLHEAEKTELGLQLLGLVPASSGSVARDLQYWKGVLASESGDVESGLNALEEAVAADATPNRRYRLADALMRARRFEDAARQFEKLDRENVDRILRAESRFSRAFCLAQLKRHVEAAGLLATLDTDDVPADLRMDAVFARAENLFEAGSFAQARTVYASAVKRSDDEGRRSQALYKQGWCSFRMNDYTRALTEFRQLEKSSQADNLVSEARHLAARCLEKLGRHDEALRIHEEVAASSSGGDYAVRSLLVLAEEHRAAGRFERALDCYGRLDGKKLDEGDRATVTFGRAAALAGAGKDADAAQEWTAFLQSHPHDSRGGEARIGQAWSYYKLRRFDSARAACRESLEDAALEGERLFIAGLIEREAGKHRAAVDHLRLLVEMNPPHPRSREACLLAGLSAAQVPDPQSAEKLLRAFTGMPGKEDADVALYELAFVLMDLDQAAEAEQILGRLVRDFPKSRYAADGAFRLGEKLYGKDEFKSALQAYQFCVQSAADDDLKSKARYKAGWSALKLNLLKQAADLFLESAGVGGQLEAESLFQAGGCFFELQQFEDSLKAYERLQRKHGSHELSGQASQRILCILSKLNRHRDVLKRAAGILSTTAEDAWSLDAWEATAESARALKVWGTAKRAYRHVAEKGARRSAARARYLAAECVLADDGREAAVDAYLKVSVFHEEKDWTARALTQTALILEELKRPAEALKMWREIVKNCPQQKEAARAAQAITRLEATEDD